MPRPIPTPIGHFTHIDNLPAIARGGLVCDALAHQPGMLVTEVGEPSIKERRRRRVVKVSPGGVVADYVPFYFASRSPMMYTIHRGNVETFTGDTYDLVYLITTVDLLIEQGHHLVFTDRNAYYGYADHTNQVTALDTLVDWELMRATMWQDTPDDKDRMERRMAECLVHRSVPWGSFNQIVVHDKTRAERVRSALATLEVAIPPIHVSPRSYF